MKLLKKLKRDIQAPTRIMKLTFLRIVIYPFITFMSILPLFYYDNVYIKYKSKNSSFEFIGDTFINLIGLFYSFALGFTPEFRNAIKFHKRKPTRTLPIKELLSFRDLYL